MKKVRRCCSCLNPPRKKVGPARREILYLPPRDLAQEKWNGPRMGPDDPAIKEKTGFADVEVLQKLHETLANLGRDFPEIYTELPGPHEEGYPHAANWSNWIKGAVSHVTLKDVSPAVGTLRAIKSPGELALIQKAIDPSIDAHLAAIKMMHSGLYEYRCGQDGGDPRLCRLRDRGVRADCRLRN